MHDFIRDSIIEQAEDQGYRLIETDSNRLWFSLDGTSRPHEREALLRIAEDSLPLDFTAHSIDRRYVGSIACGWKYGSTLLTELAEKGSAYIAMTPEETKALEEKLWILPAAEEFADMDAFITEVMTGTKSEASERIKELYVKGANKELEQRRRLTLLTKIKLDAPRN